MKAKQFIKYIRFKTSQYFDIKGFSKAKCGYILEKQADWNNNIIDSSVTPYIDSEVKNRTPGDTFALHKYIHHGLSSQACLFNLLGPFIANNSYDIIQEIVNLSGVCLKGGINKIKFEHTDRNIFKEGQQQPTSVDLYIETNEDEKIIGEFKFTESEFGTCSVYEDGDCDGLNPKNDFDLCYLHKKKGREYLNLMQKHNLLWDSNPCQFTEFYQAYRLLLFALENNGSFLLIYDNRNPAFIYEDNGKQRGKFIRFLDLLPDKIRAKVFKLSIQEIVEFLEKNNKPIWLDEFKEKYI
ncbi:MAG: hypothetical protein NTY74_16315 [Ignavibacteriae bacterium]|nr:hypothetical protein [Ignavibacteriota bacterium]